MNYPATAVGLLAVAIYVTGYQQKKRKRIVFCGVVSRALYILQYLLLGAFAGAVLDVIGIIASFLAGMKHKEWVRKHMVTILIVLNISMVVGGVVLYLWFGDIYSPLPVIGVMLQTGAFWLDDEKKIRRMSLAGCPFWVSYNFISRAYGSVVGDLLSIVSLVIAMIRYDLLKKTTDTKRCEEDEENAV
ncbi:MAG: YgjV family protein [Clostridia bacterium]|nr:YgjV family protein [Clostridia bacterium]